MSKTKEVTVKPATVEEHRTFENVSKKSGAGAVNEALKFPTGDIFEKELTEILNNRSEESCNTVAIALIDLDRFMHINEDFGRETGDRVLIETGKYIAGKIPEDCKVYRIGGDEFGLIFEGDTEREDIFLFLNDLKNGFDVKTPDGVVQSMTIGMATAGVDASRYAELVRKADSALYRAKVNGRGKVAMAREEKMIPKTSHFAQEQLQRLSKLSKQEGIGEAILLREALDLLLKKYDI